MDSPYDEDQRTYQNTVVRGLYAMGAMQGPSMMVVCLPVDKDGVVDEHQAVFLGTADAMPAIETLMREMAWADACLQAPRWMREMPGMPDGPDAWTAGQMPETWETGQENES